MANNSTETLFYFRVKEKYHELTKAEKKAADFMIHNQEKIIYCSISDVAESAKTSDATMVRICKKLGYEGFQDLKISLARQLINKNETIHEELKSEDGTEQIIEKTFNGIIKTLTMTRDNLEIDPIKKAIDAIYNSSKLVIIGSGNSRAIAYDAQHKFMRIGLNVSAYSDSHLQMIAVSSLKPGDVVLALSHSGSSRDIVEAMKVAKTRNVIMISLTSSGISPASKLADINLFTYSQETKYRLYALSSRLASLAIVDTLYLGMALLMGDKAFDKFDEIDKYLSTKKY